MSGLQLLDTVRVRYPDVVLLMATGVDDLRVGVHAMKRGAEGAGNSIRRPPAFS